MFRIFLKQYSEVPNAGDVASGYIVSRLLQTQPVILGEEAIGQPNLMAIGSILH
jgi:pyruvyltransferase